MVIKLMSGDCAIIMTIIIISPVPVVTYFLVVITPRTHAQQGVKQLILSVIISMKITRSRDLGITNTLKHNESYKIVETPATLCFKSVGKAHERCKFW